MMSIIVRSYKPTCLQNELFIAFLLFGLFKLTCTIYSLGRDNSSVSYLGRASVAMVTTG